MSRFAKDMEALSADIAFQEYAKKYGHIDGPAEWIANLHREYWEVLEQLKMSEGERVAKMRADLQIVKRDLQGVQTVLGVQRTTLGIVLGETNITNTLKTVAGDLRSALQRLEDIAKEPGT